MKNPVFWLPGNLGLWGLLGAVSLVGLAGCFDNDPGMQERLIRAQVELQEQKQKLQDTEAALQRAQAALKAAQSAAPTTPAATPAEAPAQAAAPSKQELEDTYLQSAKEMKKDLVANLTGYTVVNCTLYEVNTVAVLPYTSKVAVALRSDKGQPFKVEMPVGADQAGKWKFPTTKEILENLKNSPAGQPPGNKTVASSSQQSGTTPGNPVEGPRQGPFQPRGQDRPPAPPPVSDGNVETVQFNWSKSQTRPSSGDGGGRSPGGGASGGSAPVPPPIPPSTNTTASESRPAPAPAPRGPQQPSQPAPAMPSDQSVLVTF